MSKVYNTELQARVQAYMEENGLTMRAAATSMGLGDRTKLSLWLGSKYERGDVGKMEAQISEFFRILDAQQAQPVYTSPVTVGPERYVPTSISRKMYNKIQYTQITKGVGIIHGDSGIGKTVTAAKYVEDNPSTAIYIDVDPVTGVLSRFIRRLAEELKIPHNRDQGYLLDEIKAKLLGTNIVLIIDEAQHLKYTTMELITRWTDPHPLTHKPGIGIALVGNSQIYDRMSRRNKFGMYDQQMNRSRPMGFSRMQLTREDVSLLFPGVGEAGREQEASFLYELCHRERSLRNAAFIWNDAVNAMDVSYKNLKCIAQSMGILVA